MIIAGMIIAGSGEFFSHSRAWGQTAPPAGVITRTLQAELLKTIDASHSRAGDEVTARTITPLDVGGTNLPAGTILRGHITDADTSRITLVFDHVESKKSATVSVGLSLRAVMMPRVGMKSPPKAGSAEEQISPSAQALGSGGSAMRSPGVAASDSSDTIFKGPRSGTQRAPTVETRNGGVIGLPDIHLQVSDDPRAGATFNTEKGHKLRLEKGLQMMFVVSPP